MEIYVNSNHILVLVFLNTVNMRVAPTISESWARQTRAILLRIKGYILVVGKYEQRKPISNILVLIYRVRNRRLTVSWLRPILIVGAI